MTEAEREQSVSSTLAIADDWKAKGNVRWELTNVSSALDDYLSIAVTYRDTVAGGIAYLREKGCPELLARSAALNDQLIAAFAAGARNAAVDNDVTPAHLAWLLDQPALGDHILDVVRDPQIARHWPHTKFWAEYDRAMACLVARTPYTPQPPKLRGYEKCWAPYLDLVAALTQGQDPAPALAACAASFERRNGDKRLTDWKQHDGDGRLPVRWDFRVPSILARWQTATAATVGSPRRFPAGAPTDPDVRISRIRLFGLAVRCATAMDGVRDLRRQ
jgi:hypothetical protein